MAQLIENIEDNDPLLKGLDGGGEDGPPDDSRRKFLIGATTAAGAIGAVFVAIPFLSTWKPSERARALGVPVELDLSKLDPGQMAVIIWRKQPIYVVHRTPEMLGSLVNHDARLKDPTSEKSDQPAYAHNTVRAIQPAFLVLIGICTHLGCLPKPRFEKALPELGADWPGGFFCPCHGSRFDLAGRVFDGSPASLNLRIPPYTIHDHTLTVGAGSAKGAA